MWGYPRSFPRAIIHLDGDAFFASCEVAKNPALRGKPVVTGKERGIVSSLTYEAKRLGISRAMPLHEIKKKFPQVIIVPSKYKTHKLSKIVLTVDSNEKMHKPTLSGFEKFVEKSKIKLTLLHVRTEDEISDPVITTAKINGKKLPIEILEAKDIQGGVKKYINKREADMVAIISKKHSAFYNFFSESNTKKIAFVAKVPVMAIHE